MARKKVPLAGINPHPLGSNPYQNEMYSKKYTSWYYIVIRHLHWVPRGPVYFPNGYPKSDSINFIPHHFV